MDFDSLTPEQIEKAKACKTPEELLALAKDEGLELSEEQLDSVAGGVAGWGVPDTYPNDTTPVPEPHDYFL